MKVTFEHPVITFENGIADMLLGFVNEILDADNEKNLRMLVTNYVEMYDFDRFFIYGYGHRHLWVKQRIPLASSDNRILIVEY